MRKERRQIQLHRETLRSLERVAQAGQAALAGQAAGLRADTADSCDVGSCAAPDRCCSGEGTTCMT